MTNLGLLVLAGVVAACLGASIGLAAHVLAAPQGCDREA